VDTHTPPGRLLFGMLLVIAQFELELRAERQREGIAKAKRAGVHFGRTKALTPEQADELRAMRAQGVTLTALMQRYALGKIAVYRYLGQGEHHAPEVDEVADEAVCSARIHHKDTPHVSREGRHCCPHIA
jgi:DNA invertase Pin-like site-specific DNA recombinase